MEPSIAAPAWSPTSFSVAPPQPAPAPAPAPPADEPEEEIDENDPLWQAVLKIAEGDRAKAMTLIGDPDSLMTYPEVAAILESSEPMETEQETAVEELVEQVEDMKIDEPLAPAVAEPSPPPAPAPALAEADEAEEEIIPVENLPEGDPREHLNLVFIGHVDAGKSTLSGNILYITENVDKRTIERYERKQRNAIAIPGFGLHYGH
ncbi:hypothetical protein MHU86_21831 [Fragilaria crotonensis]|nr:hypothetical protein MHU86_21831 [Fragilaria crotonensis]